jgi:hypothetical protein
MKSTTLIGIVLLMLGVLALVVPIPRRESRGVKIDNTKIGIQTETREKLPPAVGIVLLAGGRRGFVSGITQGLGRPRAHDMLLLKTFRRKTRGRTNTNWVSSILLTFAASENRRF